jgi:hypothetical protein
MCAVTNVAGENETRRKLAALTNTLTALVGLLVLGFPVTPATIRTTIATSALVVVATLQLVFRHITTQVRLAYTSANEDALQTSERSQPLRVVNLVPREDLRL